MNSPNAYRDAVTALHAEDGERDYLFVSRSISRDLHKDLSRQIANSKQNTRATLFLNTYGGDPDGAFRIARCLRHHYTDGIRVAIPHWCKSAGTLIAMAADEIGVGDFGELGPLDIQVYKGSELQERSSGLDITEAMGAVTEHIKDSFHLVLKETRNLGLSTKISAEFATQVSAAIAAPLFGQLDPLRFGELVRLTRIASEYGHRLNQYGKNLRDGALIKLIHGYPSHSFVIDRKEAKELFVKVTALTSAEQSFCEVVWHVLEEQSNIACFVVQETNEAANEEAHEQSPESNNESASHPGTEEQPGSQDGGAAPGAESLRAGAGRPRRTQGIERIPPAA